MLRGNQLQSETVGITGVGQKRLRSVEILLIVDAGRSSFFLRQRTIHDSRDDRVDRFGNRSAGEGDVVVTRHRQDDRLSDTLILQVLVGDIEVEPDRFTDAKDVSSKPVHLVHSVNEHRFGQTVDDIEFAGLETKFPGRVVGDIPDLDPAEFRRAAEVVVIRNHQHAGLRRVAGELERARSDRLVGKTVCAECLIGLLADDVAAGVVGELRKEDRGSDRGSNGDLDGHIVDLLERIAGVVTGNARCVGIGRLLQREDHIIRRQRVRLRRRAGVAHGIVTNGEGPRLRAVRLADRLRNGRGEIRLERAAVARCESNKTVEDHVDDRAVLGTGRQVRIERRLVTRIRCMDKNWSIVLSSCGCQERAKRSEDEHRYRQERNRAGSFHFASPPEYAARNRRCPVRV